MESVIFRNWKEEEIRMLHPLKLAYIGDAIYEIYIRRYLIENYKDKMNIIHKKSTKYVSAKAQADILRKIEEILTDEEKSVIRRGRNTKSNSVPKNTDISEYKYSTGFEALIGYLYLSKKIERIDQIIKKILED